MGADAKLENPTPNREGERTDLFGISRGRLRGRPRRDRTLPGMEYPHHRPGLTSEEEPSTLRSDVGRYPVEQGASDAQSSSVGADRHPRNLHALIKPRLKCHEPHNLAVVLGDEPPL